MKKKEKFTVEQQMEARPVRLPGAEFVAGDGGGGRVTVAVKATGWGQALLRMPAEGKKTFELDAIGAFVWDSCDGKTSVKQIIKKVAKRYDLNLRAAQVPTMKFLEMLAKRGLIGVKGRKGH